MKAKTMEGREIDLKQETLDGLKMRLRGPVLVPGDASYDESRTVWNAMIDRKPAAVARCLGIADVIACVQFAAEHDLLLCIKGGGHNIAGLATADGALMLDMSLMRGVWVDPQRKVAHAQAGCLLGDVDRETQVHGLAAVLGFVSLTGITGLTLGGGFGYLTRRWGWTSDNVVGMNVVTADARLVRASSDENADLFWGLRGGGGNFGVVAGIDYMLHPVGPEIVGGAVAWPNVTNFFKKAMTEKCLAEKFSPLLIATMSISSDDSKPHISVLHFSVIAFVQANLTFSSCFNHLDINQNKDKQLENFLIVLPSIVLPFEKLVTLVAWPASEAPKVLELYRTLAEKAPPELTLVALMRPAPPAPWLPKDMHGKPIVGMLACYSRRPDEGEKLVVPIKSFGKPVGDVLMRRPYAQLQSLLDATQPKGRRYYWKSEYLPRIEPALCEKVIAHAARIRSPHSAVILFQIEGALNRLEEAHSPVGNRDARYVLNIAGSWEKADEDRANVEWAREAWDDMKSFSTGGTYINFLTEDEGPERIQAALGKGLKRLAEVKVKWDPQNVFRTNRNIKPA